MKIIVVLSIVATAFASLEPAGYRPPGSSPSARYLPSNQYSSNSIVPPSNQYLPANRYSASSSEVPSNQYLPAHKNNSPSMRYLPSNNQQAPSTRYLPASKTQQNAHARVSAPSSTYLPANNYQAQAQISASPSRYSGTPASFYGSPSSSQYSAPVAAPVNRYLPANNGLSNTGNSGYRYNEMEESEPAKYEFHYEVKDNYGNDFGHQENRDGDNTQGMYAVLLPDGRKQIVEYTADKEGYKPRISYEEPEQGYNRRGNDAASGYSQGYPQGSY